jgi:hypothetical protein
MTILESSAGAAGKKLGIILILFISISHGHAKSRTNEVDQWRGIFRSFIGCSFLLK